VKKGIARAIPLCGICGEVLGSIDFDCKLSLGAKEVQDVTSKLVLASELGAEHSTPAEVMPELVFGVRRFATQFSGETGENWLRRPTPVVGPYASPHRSLPEGEGIMIWAISSKASG
jgi:hypothetical protein